MFCPHFVTLLVKKYVYGLLRS